MVVKTLYLQGPDVDDIRADATGSRLKFDLFARRGIGEDEIFSAHVLGPAENAIDYMEAGYA